MFIRVVLAIILLTLLVTTSVKGSKYVGNNKKNNSEFTGQVQSQAGVTAQPFPYLTCEQARQRILNRDLPKWWISDLDGLQKQLGRIKKGRISTIAQSPSGRAIHLVTYGEREDQKQLANFNSAIGAREPKVYRDKASRKKPVILFVGPVPGHEVEGMTGLSNLIKIMEIGKDLRGMDQSKLQALGQKCRLLIIPNGNPDGVTRFEPRSLVGMTFEDMRFWGQGTRGDGTLWGWPRSKRQHPMVGNNVGFLGCYFNDKGINPMHDEFFAPMSTEAPALLRVAQEEAPDLAVSLHSHNDMPTLIPPAYVPREIKEEVQSLAGKCYDLLDKRSLPHVPVFKIKEENGKKPPSFNLLSALYHISGTTVFTFESPHGLAEESWNQKSFDGILDIQLALYEVMMCHELDKKCEFKLN